MLPSSVHGCIYKVNRRQAREGALGYKVNRRQAREGALGYSVSRKGMSAIQCSTLTPISVYSVDEPS